MQAEIQQAKPVSTRESSNAKARSNKDRVFKKDLHWFFHTREGAPKGPFIDKQHAYWALAKYIRQQCSYQ